MYRRTMLERVRAGEQIEDAIHLLRRPKQARRSEHHTAPCVRGIDSAEIDRRAFARPRPFDGRAVHLQAAHSRSLRSGIQLELILKGERSGDKGTGDDGAVAFHGKAAVDGKAWVTRRVLAGDVHRGVFERGFERVDTLAG